MNTAIPATEKANRITSTQGKSRGGFFQPKISVGAAAPKTIQRQLVAPMPPPMVRSPMPVRPPLRVIQGGGGYRPGTGVPGRAGSEGTYSEPIYAPDPYDNSLDAIMARAAINANRERSIAQYERPRATLSRGGQAPDFITRGPRQQVMAQNDNYSYAPQEYHVLDAMEYEISRARTAQDLENIRQRFMPEVYPPTTSPYQVPLITPLPFPFNPVVYPDNFDPGAVMRRRAFTQAVRRVNIVPTEAQRIALQTDADRELQAMNRRRRRPDHYPICWARVLGPPTTSIFSRVVGADRDDDEARQARMRLEWRAYRDPEYIDPTKFHIHHLTPLFLGGADDLVSNGSRLEKDKHMYGHMVLRYQPQMLFPPPGLPPLPIDLYRHGPNVKYELVGYKEREHELCGS